MAGSAFVLLVLAIAQAPSFWHVDSFLKKYSGNNLYSNANTSQLPSVAYTQATLSQQQDLAAEETGASTGEAVLGASTYDKSVPAQFSSLQIATSQDNSAAAIQSYATQVNVVIADEVTKNSTPAQFQKLASDLQAIAVPSSIEDYQRLLVESAILASTGDPQDLMAEITPVMQTISAAVQGSTNVTLPVLGSS